MIYSGADLIRTSGQQLEKAERLKVAQIKAVEPANETRSALDDDTRGALERFARFIHDRPSRKSKASGIPATTGAKSNPYALRAEAERRMYDRGGMLDIYI